MGRPTTINPDEFFLDGHHDIRTPNGKEEDYPIALEDYYVSVILGKEVEWILDSAEVLDAEDGKYYKSLDDDGTIEVIYSLFSDETFDGKEKEVTLKVIGKIIDRGAGPLIIAKSIEKTRNTIDRDGYTHMPKEVFKEELDKWVKQINVGLGQQTPHYEEAMYNEMVDWLDDNVALEYDEDNYMHKIHVYLTSDGIVEIVE